MIFGVISSSNPTPLQQHYQLQGGDAGRFMLHHTSDDAMMNHYLLGTESLAPVQLRLGMLGLTNPTYEVRTTSPTPHIRSTNLSFPGCFQVSPYDISGNVRNVEKKRPGSRRG